MTELDANDIGPENSGFNDILDAISVAVTTSQRLEELVRPLLAILDQVTGLESTYLTRVDEDQGVQHILYSRNSQAMCIPEGLSVPWQGTLCKRALDQKRGFADDVAERWADSAAALELGIATYVSEPVRFGDGSLYGTLCGASAQQKAVDASAQRVLALFARLIAQQIEREELIHRLRSDNRSFRQKALEDPLTGLPNRRAVDQELEHQVSISRRTGLALHLAFIDLDGFKAINDQYGHDAGDRFLLEIARALSTGLRSGDFIGRYGGDEFVFIGPAPELVDAPGREAVQHRLEALTQGQFDVGCEIINYGGASVGIVSSSETGLDAATLLEKADAAMYARKLARKKANT